MVEIEVRKAEPHPEKTESTNIDITEIIGKIRGFIDTIRTMSSEGTPMGAHVEAFNFSVGKVDGEYELTLKLNLAFKPKTAA
ncbi:MAG: hypothetical protein NWE98_06295 [Candidatus Bathyarchaeota archaeon]|nr:hypothetical protein [Candidatus Bathyarchaeota archaeon]